MAIENAWVGRVSRIEPPVVGSGAEMLERHPDGVRVFLPEGASVLLGGGDRDAGYLDVLEGLRKLDAPVFLELERPEGPITRLLIPLVVRVVGMAEREDRAEVDLEISHARHRVARSNPDYDELVDTLNKAMSSGQLLWVTETDDHEIVDVRAEPRPPSREGGRTYRRTEREGDRFLDDSYFATTIRAIVDAWRCWWRYIVRLLRWFCCPSPARAQELFDLVAARSCDPQTVPVPCIPFLYPDDGCWGRAHEMCRLMIDEGADPDKVWIYGSLHVDTANNPNCFVQWGWHVAPTLCVRNGWLRTTRMVIDPALFSGPVTKATWKGVQGDPGAALEDSDASIFYRSQGAGFTQTDPTYTQSDTVLATYRLQLQNRANQFGPPPYACP